MSDRLKVEKKKQVRFLLVGNGTVSQAKEFVCGERKLRECFQRNPNFELYVDPSLSTYAKFGLLNSVLATLNPKGLSGLLTAKSEHDLKVGGLKGSAFQQGGTFVIEKHNILFAHSNESTGDHADTQQLFKILSV